MAELGRTAARGAGVTVGAQVVRFALQMVSLTVLARLLTPAQFGVVAMVTSVTGVAEIVRDFGLSSAAIQAKTLSTAERDNLTWINTGIGVGCAVVVAAAAPLLAGLYSDPRVVPITLALAWLFIVSGANTQYRADLSRRLKFGQLATTDIVAQSVGIVVAIWLATRGAGYWAIVAQQVTMVVVTFLTNVWFCRWLPGRPRRDVPMKRFFGFGGAVFTTQALGFAMNNVDNAAIGAAWGPGPLGLYTRAYQLLQVPLTQLNAPLSRVSLPVLSRVQDDTATLQRYVDRFQLISCYTLGLGFAVAAGLSEPVVALLFGPGWQGVVPLFTLLAVGGIVKAFQQVPYQVFLAKGLTRQLMRFYLVTRPIMLVVILAGLPWGPQGVAVGHLVAALGSWVATLLAVSRWAGLTARTQFLQSARCLALVAAPAGVLAWWVASLIGPTVLRLVAGGAVAAVWTVAIVAVVPALRRDTGQVLSLAKNLRGNRG